MKRMLQIWVLALGLCQGSRAETIGFAEVTAQAGITFRHIHGGGGENPQKYFIETMGAGCAFLDYDRDGHLDIFAVNGYDLTRKAAPRTTDALYQNQGNGKFAELTRTAGIEAGEVGYGMGCCAGDADNDGYPELYVTNYGPNVFYHNKGDGTFRDVTQKTGTGDPRWSTGCAFADYDLDGDLDLYAANYVEFSLADPGENLRPYVALSEEALKGIPAQKVKTYPHPDNYEGVADVLYRNDGEGKFADVTRAAGVFDPTGKGLGVVWGDYDNDGDPDIYVANDQTPNFLYRNDGRGKFTDVALIAGVAYSEDGRTQAGMGVDLGDYDNDGLLDIWVTNFQGEPNTLSRNEGNGFFSDVSFASGTGRASLPYVGWGTGFFDFDHDGLKDIFVANGHVLDNVELFDKLSRYPQPGLLFRNNGPGADGAFKFADITRASGGPLAVERVGRGVALGDCDNDGDTDLLISSSNSPLALLRNEGKSQNNWLTIELKGAAGPASGGSNRDALGTRVRVTAGALVQIAEVKSGGSYLSQSDLRLNFGLDRRPKADRVEVRWPSDKVAVFEDIAANQFITIQEREGIVDGR